MIGLIRGLLLKRMGTSVLVDCNGVGYEVVVSDSSMERLPAPEREVTLFTHLVWKDDGVTLYGFLEEEEREMFRILIQVSGVGPRMAMNCLSVLGPVELLKALSSGDVRRLQAVSGIGKKTAARLCVDLKEKAKRLLNTGAGTAIGFGFKGDEEEHVIQGHGDLWHEAYSALFNLGYRPQEIRRALSAVFKELDSQIRTGKKEDGRGRKYDIGSIVTHALRRLAS